MGMIFSRNRHFASFPLATTANLPILLSLDSGIMPIDIDIFVQLICDVRLLTGFRGRGESVRR